MKKTSITVKINEETKQEFMNICKRNGTNASAVIRGLIEYVGQNKKMPFVFLTEEDKTEI